MFACPSSVSFKIPQQSVSEKKSGMGLRALPVQRSLCEVGSRGRVGNQAKTDPGLLCDLCDLCG